MADDSSTTSRTRLPPMAPGQRYGRLVAVAFHSRGRRGKSIWTFQCDCGAQAVAKMDNVRGGNTSSCGCLLREWEMTGKVTHGRSASAEYQIWENMLSRCLNPNVSRYARYGGRGIKICERWLTFANFYADMGPRPPGMTLERIDNDGNYEPSNVRWATRKEQECNKSTTIKVVLNGHEMTLSDACRATGVSYNAVRKRISYRGWSVDKALSTPVLKRAR